MVEYARRDECSILCERYGKNRKTLDMQDMAIAGIHSEKIEKEISFSLHK